MFLEKLKSLNEQFKEVEAKLGDSSVVTKQDEYRELTKQHSYLLPLSEKYIQYSKLLTEIKDAEELKKSDDAEIKEMASAEYDDLVKKKDLIESEIKVLLIPPDPHENKNIILEIRAGTGGDEAALFVGDLYRMYTRFAERNGWKHEVIDSNPTGLGGYKEVVFEVNGDRVWRYYKFERGAHRVQRVPETEASGRVHTSAVTVAVLPEAQEVDLEIKMDELRIDTYRASGAGGQHVNKTDSAIRITHLPTGLVVACQDERSQIKNRAKAFKVLRAKLYEQKVLEHEKMLSDERKAQVGTGDRSEKIRTYNFPQNRITDHRIGYSVYNISEVMDGDLAELVNKLIEADTQAKLKADKV
ncbi:peptide chain release factor 1 [Endomicrobium proavitum]|uniref:Peptide chain release factor 1 n=1 Tax=Endomicrobium proavitum TaxID=1408281 RepID=A0A0G3WJJ0_9BACT|nr:peptide chain release factor 1 [Endomicrobium proavitum]AKL98045.1 peptide chain release factor RF-1 [Endomicrobium proavitum]